MTNQCKHGQLARVCPLCEKDEQIRVLREALEAVVADGYLYHSVEGMSAEQKQVLDALEATK